MVRDLTNLPALKMVGPGVFELEKVRIDKQQRAVSFPATVNKRDGGMEYFLVTGYGKVHESIFRTSVAPLHIHVAMVLLNAKGAGTNLMASAPPQYGGIPGLSIPGDPITIEVSWREEDKEITRRAEELFIDPAADAPLEKRPWVFNGSVLWQGIFLAQQSGSIISLIPDPIALMNSAAPTRAETVYWIPKGDKLPPSDVPVRITIKLKAIPSEK